MLYDYQSIIVWKSQVELINIIENNFKDKIVIKKEIIINQHERKIAVNQIYHPIIVNPIDERFFQTDKI